MVSLSNVCGMLLQKPLMYVGILSTYIVVCKHLHSSVFSHCHLSFLYCCYMNKKIAQNKQPWRCNTNINTVIWWQPTITILGCTITVGTCHFPLVFNILYYLILTRRVSHHAVMWSTGLVSLLRQTIGSLSTQAFYTHPERRTSSPIYMWYYY